MKWEMISPNSGDMVRVKSGRIYHYGVFVSDSEVIQFGLAPIARQGLKDSDIEVCASDVDTFLQGGFLEVAVFDKTGTVTTGELSVSEIWAEEGESKASILRLAASLEQLSNHPMAKAVLKKAEGLPLFTPTRFEEHQGRGLSGEIGGTVYYLGNSRFMKEQGIAIPKEYENLQVLLATHKLLGGILLSDTVREDMADAIASLKDMGIEKTVMLSGDKSAHVEKIAKAVGIDTYEGELLPSDKYARLEALLCEGKGVIFVGDGINDVPSLARADVGIAMGGIGSDAAIEVADIVLADDAPAKLPKAMRIARRTVSIARANVVFALGVKFTVMALSLTNLLGGIMWLAVFADVGVSVIAILNAMRCLKVK